MATLILHEGETYENLVIWDDERRDYIIDCDDIHIVVKDTEVIKSPFVKPIKG